MKNRIIAIFFLLVCVLIVPGCIENTEPTETTMWTSSSETTAEATDKLGLDRETTDLEANQEELANSGLYAPPTSEEIASKQEEILPTLQVDSFDEDANTEESGQDEGAMSTDNYNQDMLPPAEGETFG